ncbi:hypothetical protein EV122DRAFT_253688 [Schizophyllum commune]
MLDGPTSKAELQGAVLTGWRKKRRPQPWARVLEPVTTGIEGDNQGAPETAEGGPTSGHWIVFDAQPSQDALHVDLRDLTYDAAATGIRHEICLMEGRLIAHRGAYWHLSTCLDPSSMQPMQTTHHASRHGTFYLNEGDLVARRATTHFDTSIQSLGNEATQEGGHEDRPLVLDGVKSLDFEHLLWFFYESAYRWLGIVDPALTIKWESVLLLAEKFNMRQAAKVACYALGRAGILSDVVEELKRVIVRVNPLTREEGRELGSDTTVILAEARETLRPQVTAPAACTGASGIFPDHRLYYGGSCSAGVHMYNSYGCRRVATQDTVLSLHSYHLRKASKALEDMLISPFTGVSGEGQTRDCPIVLDIETHRFRNFLWFLYDSAYEWQVTPLGSYKADPESASKWEDILVVADMFNMEEVCRVATYALDHNGGLPDVRKIALCVRHEVDKSWAFEAIKRVCARQEALTEEEACDMGLKMAINIASAREIAYKSSGGSTTDTSHRPMRHGTYYIDEGDLVVRAEDTLYRFHSFHLQRATNYFDAKIQASSDAPAIEGGSDDDPLVLDDVKSQDFEYLMWFFYESAYKWSGVADHALMANWESILLLAGKFDMRQIAKVACYALGRAGVLGDVRKISLCVKHGLGKDWITEELKRVVDRDAHLTEEEGQELGVKTTILLAASREACRYKQTKAPSSCTDLPKLICVCGYNYYWRCNNDDVSARCSITAQHYHTSKADIYIKVTILIDQLGTSVLAVHSYHLKRASQVFRDMLELPREGSASTEGKCQENPTILDIEARAFESFLWFLYNSPYEWSYKTDPELSAKWEDILVVADMFNMEEVCRVAIYALDHHCGLSDIRKISLCVRHDVDKTWAVDAIERVCARQDALTKEEAREIGLDMTASIASVREAAFRASYGGGKIKCGLAKIKEFVHLRKMPTI